MLKKLLAVLLAAALFAVYAQPTAGAQDPDADVFGAWSAPAHAALADAVTNLPNADVIKAISAACDSRVYLNQHPANAGVVNAADYVYRGSNAYHAVGNYVTAARYLYALAQFYQNGTPIDFAAFDAALTGYGRSYEATSRQDIDSDIQYMTLYCTSMTPGMTQRQRLATAAFGMLFHLLGDLYAHRAIVPTSSVTVTDRTDYGTGSGGNEGRYFVLSDFRAACSAHAPQDSGEAYRARRHALFEEATQAMAEGAFPFALAFGRFLLYAIFGRLFTTEQAHEFTPEEDQQMLRLAVNIPQNIGTLCGGKPCVCAMQRIAQLGVLQFKDIKYFLNDSRYKAGMTYYEDQSPGNAFYYRRYEVARAVIQAFVTDFNAKKAFNATNLLPIYTAQMCAYRLKLDCLYNYLKQTTQALDAQPSAILRASWWQNRSDSLFDYTTIVYNGSYFVDPATYPAGDKPVYTTVFPQNGKTADSFYL